MKKIKSLIVKYSKQIVLGIVLAVMASILWIHGSENVFPNGKGIGIVILSTLLLVGVFVVSCFKLEKSYVMMLLLTLTGIMYFSVFPLGNASIPDENWHFLRAFEVSCGSMVSEHTSGGGGAYLPYALVHYDDENARIDWNDIAELSYPTMALYAPVSYFPQALGIRIARFFTDRVFILYYAGRMGGFLVCLLLSLWALKKMPFAKEVLFVIMMLPMTLQEMISVSPDGLTNALSFAFVSYVLYLTYESEKITKCDIALLTVIGITISLCKIVYVVEILLLFIIPKEKIGGKKKNLCLKIGIPGIALLMNLIWLKISAGFLIEFNPGVDSGRQVEYVLTHLHEYYVTVVRTIMDRGELWMQLMVGRMMGPLTIPTTGIIWVFFLIMLMYMACNSTSDVSRKLELRKNDLICYWLIFLGGCALILTSLYVQWTPYQAEVIEGVQGRYFIPLLMFLLLPVVYREKQVIRDENTGKMNYPYYIIVFLEGIVLIDLLKYFIG